MSLKESDIKRNPHPDFKKVEASRTPWDSSAIFHYTQTPAPDWKYGDGANNNSHSHSAAGASSKAHRHVAIDPYEAGRPPAFNYKLLISAVVPRPIAFVSTRNPRDGTTNLAPFSYFQVVNHDPPLFVIGIASPLPGADPDRTKDTLRNLVEGRDGDGDGEGGRGECVINLVGEHMVEAANAASVNAPHGASEWAVSGLTPAWDCVDVPRVPRVREAVFSIEGRLESAREFASRSRPGAVSGTMVVVEGTRFWVREDAVNAERNLVDPAVLRPISRLGGITYGRTLEGIELPRPDFEKNVGGMEAYKRLEEAARAKNMTDGEARSV